MSQTDSKPTVAVLGTGIIGAPIARNLSKHGFDVRVWNRTRSKAEELTEDGVQIADTPAKAVEGAEIVLTVLNDGPTVLETITAAQPNLARDTIWVQVSTVGEVVDELAAFARTHHLRFVDAPVQGTRQPAEQGQLVVLGAGSPDLRDAVEPLFDVIGKRTLWVGEDGLSGAASRLKLVLNTWVVALTNGVGEALALAEALGVDPQHFVDVVTGGPMDCGYFQAKSAAIRSDDYTTSFSVINAEKDARLVLEAARRVGVRMDTVEGGQARFQRAADLGHGQQDMAAGYFASFSER